MHLNYWMFLLAHYAVWQSSWTSSIIHASLKQGCGTCCTILWATTGCSRACSVMALVFTEVQASWIWIPCGSCSQKGNTLCPHLSFFLEASQLLAADVVSCLRCDLPDERAVNHPSIWLSALAGPKMGIWWSGWRGVEEAKGGAHEGAGSISRSGSER